LVEIGPTLDSYVVNDKDQVAELDPSFLLGEDWADFETEFAPCMVCGSDAHAAELMLCDGCPNTCHVACANLEELPSGDWFCSDCAQNLSMSRNTAARQGTGFRIADIIRPARARRVAVRQITQSSPRRARPMSLAEQQSQSRARTALADDAHYGRLRRQIFRDTGIDIDNPHERNTDESEATLEEHRLACYTDESIWRRRLEIARAQGAGRTFERVAQTLAPPQTSREEERAWNELDRALGVSRDHANGKKRKSRTPTPVSESEPRKFKRPKASFRPTTNGESRNTVVAESSSARAVQPDGDTDSVRSGNRADVDSSTGGNFLATLLNEVQSSDRSPPESVGGERNHGFFPGSWMYGRDGSYSPQASSPASPSISNYGTPRSMTPPISPTSRPSSPPISIARSITPLPRPALVYSPVADSDNETSRSRKRERQTPSHSPHASPLRMTTEMKSEIQRMVVDALKPYYKNKAITKDEYTGINRDVSRKLYDEVRDVGGLGRGDAKQKWHDKAEEEVRQAVEQSKAIRADSDGERSKAS
jgi:PHD-finger